MKKLCIAQEVLKCCAWHACRAALAELPGMLPEEQLEAVAGGGPQGAGLGQSCSTWSSVTWMEGPSVASASVLMLQGWEE